MLEDDKEDNELLTSDEKEKKLRTKQRKAKHKAQQGIEDMHSFSNIKRKVGTKTYKNSGNDPYGLEKEKNSLRDLGKPTVLNEEDFDIGEYLDNKIMQNAKITGQIRSTLNKFETQFGRPKKKSLVISENNSSEEENND